MIKLIDVSRFLSLCLLLIHYMQYTIIKFIYLIFQRLLYYIQIQLKILRIFEFKQYLINLQERLV